MDKWQIKFQKGSEEWLFFQDMYGTLQAFWNIESVTKDERKEYWNCLNEMVNDLRNKYKNSPLARNFTDAILKTMVDKGVGPENESKCVLEVKYLDELLVFPKESDIDG